MKNEKPEQNSVAESAVPSESDSLDHRSEKPVVVSKTPMFTAHQAARYQRQGIIKELESTTPRLICFVAGRNAQIDRDDVAGIVDLLHNVPQGEPLNLLLHTPGGDIDVTEKIITLLRATVGDDAELRIVIPDFAKSAGTFMALGANSLVMSDSSELGTIDPQVWLKDGSGNDICHSILTYLDAYKLHADAYSKNPDDAVSKLMIQKFDPAVVRKFEVIRDRARTFAENQLIRRGQNYTKITSALMSTDKWKSHNQMIGWQDAREIGLIVEYLPNTDRVWRLYWQLYCLQRLAIQDHQKLFESSYVSLIMDGS